MAHLGAGSWFCKTGWLTMTEPIFYDWAHREGAPVGAWVLEDYKTDAGQPVSQVCDLGVDTLFLPELDENGRLQPEKRAYLDGYTQRVLAGETAPSITVIEMEDGRLRVTDGHRRVMAARAAGKATVRALVSPLLATAEGPKAATRELVKTGGTIFDESDAFSIDGSAIRFSRADNEVAATPVDPTQTPAFKQWSQEAPLVRLGEKGVFKSGRPVVVEALHGTTNADLTEFKRTKANIENDLGMGFYASNSAADVATNYANEAGPDLTRKIERLAHKIAQDDEFEGEYKDALRQARATFSDGAPNTLKIYMRFANPAVLGGPGETYFDYEYGEETDEYAEPTGLLVDFVNALDEAGSDMDISLQELEDAKAALFEKAMGGGLKMLDLVRIVKGKMPDVRSLDDEYLNGTSEFLRQALEIMGFDGVIDTTVSAKFRMKGLDKETTHFIAFNPTQVKSAIGNNGAFDAANPDIRFSKAFAEPTKTPAFKTWFGDSKVLDADGDPLVVYHGTGFDFEVFRHGDVGFHFGPAQAANHRVDDEKRGDGKKTESPRLMPVYLAIKNPLRLLDAGDWDSEERVANMLSDAIVNGMVDEDAYAVAAEQEVDATGVQAFTQVFERMGYDGIVYENVAEGGGDSWIAFHPSQIKSAIGNVGDFDGSQESILRSEAAAAAFVSSIEVIEHALIQAYGNALPRLRAQGLVSLIETEDKALQAAAAARALKLHTSAAVELRRLRASVLASRRVWHGTPHRDITKFSTDKIGAGEGAQAFGWGLYFADRRELGDYYREKLQGGVLGYDASLILAKSLVDQGLSHLESLVWKASVIDAIAPLAGKGVGQLRDVLFRVASGLERGGFDWQLAAAPLVRELARNDAALNALNTLAVGQLYELDIPSDTDMLLWDKPLSEQNPAFNAAMRQAAAEWADTELYDKVLPEVQREQAKPVAITQDDFLSMFSAENAIESAAMDRTVNERVKAHPERESLIAKHVKSLTAPDRASGMATGKSFYESLAKQMGQQKASEYLAGLGLKGIKYLDGLSRNKALRDVKGAFLEALPEDADFAQVMALLGTGTFSDQNEALIKALADSDWLGFDSPSLAISTALGSRLQNHDPSPDLVRAVAATQDDSTYNYVVFSGDDVQIVDVHCSADGNLQGFFDPATGQSFLVADHLTAQTAPGVFLHEAGIHMAASGKLKPLFDRALALLSEGQENPFIQRVRFRMDRAGETSGEEAAAYIVEEYERDRLSAPKSIWRWVRDFSAGVRAWLFGKGVVVRAAHLSAADMAAIARSNVRMMVRSEVRDQSPLRSILGDCIKADHGSLCVTKPRLSEGEDAELVRRETGWFRGVDGQWRYEISNEGAKFVEQTCLAQKGQWDPAQFMADAKNDGSFGEGFLGDLMDHPALFAAYPELKNLRVEGRIRQGLEGGSYDG
jgi:hypothetical protein